MSTSVDTGLKKSMERSRSAQRLSERNVVSTYQPHLYNVVARNSSYIYKNMDGQYDADTFLDTTHWYVIIYNVCLTSK
jgi:hypothetical protein